MIDEETRKRIREDAEDICKLAGLPELADEVAKLLPILEFEHQAAVEIEEAYDSPPPPPDASDIDNGWEWFAKKSWVPNLRGRLVEMTGWEQTFKRRGGNPGKRRKPDAIPLGPLHNIWPTIMAILPSRPAFHREYGDTGDTLPSNKSARMAYEIARWVDYRYTAANCYSVQTRWKRGED